MPEATGSPDFNSPVIEHARKDFPLLDADMTVGKALDRIRREGVGERVIYFFAVDSDKRLVGVLPTRRLLTNALETPLRDIMVRRVVAIPATATVLDACEFFVLYKFFAFPVVDEQRRVVGLIDVSLFAEEILGEREEQLRPTSPVRDDVFEVLGFHLEQIRGASPWRVFRFRFPWLLVTVSAGTICAILARAFEATLARSLIVAFFLTMVLGLNESVSAQSMSVTIQMLRSAPVTWSWFATALRREFITTKIPSQIIVVDNGSDDRTAERARDAGAQVVTAPRGYGRACAAGVRALSPNSDIIVFLDGDGSDCPEFMPQLVDPIAAGTHDFVIGSRTRGQREPGSMNAQQIFAGRFAGWLMSIFYGVRYTDMCPFRAIRRDALERVSMKEETYGWNLEMQMKAARLGLRILEVPVNHRRRTGGVSKVSGTLRGTFVAGARIIATFARIATEKKPQMNTG